MNRDEAILNSAIQAMQDSEPDAADVRASATSLAEKLGIDQAANQITNSIASCHDVRTLLPSYRSGAVSAARRLLIEAHLHECPACRRDARNGAASAAIDWSAPRARTIAWNPRAIGWSLATAATLLLSASFLYRAYWQVPPGVRAEVQSIDGSAYRVDRGADHLLAAGDKIADGELIRTSGGAHAVLRLADGSSIEVNERSLLALGARGHNMTVTLDDGDMIVQAAKRTSGHMYVKTPDCRVAVVGTVFSVNSGIKGSRVGVLQGSVHVSHAGIDTVLAAGNEITTNANLGSVPVAQQISWSHDRDKYLPLLAQFATLQHRIEDIPLPAPRFTSDLLPRVPADALFYMSVPNLGDFLSQANQIFHDQLKQSPALQEWWNHGHGENSAELDALIENIHQASQYLGDEIVIVGIKGQTGPRLAVVADLRKPGLDEYLKTQFPVSGPHGGLNVLNAGALENPVHSGSGSGALALIEPNQVVFSNDIATLKLVDAQLNEGPSGFATGPFGQQISAAYGRGAGIILAADIQQMMNDKSFHMHAGRLQSGKDANEVLHASGLEDMRYLIAEHREASGAPENHLSLQFAGARRGVASWLASPAPIGSLNFITPNASVAVAALSKDPKAIADDILSMAQLNTADNRQQLETAEAALQVNFRDDLAASLGGDFLLALDGPVLPTPSWKAVIEVHDANRLEQSLERLAETLGKQPIGPKGLSIAIDSSNVDGQLFYALHDLTSGKVLAQYTFAEGYMIAAPSRALLMEALQTNASGNSLAHSAAFKALLPKDTDENYSAVAYQNLTPVLGPLLSQFNGQGADTLRKFAADARPTVICARGEQDRIDASTDSKLFGFDFLTLETLMRLGNNHAALSVKD